MGVETAGVCCLGPGTAVLRKWATVVISMNHAKFFPYGNMMAVLKKERCKKEI